MTGHLGTLARMVPVVPTAAQREVTPDRYLVQDARARRWAFDTARPDGTMLRTWDIDLGLLDQREAGLLREVLHGAWGPGPWRWVPCSAHDTNVLTPQQSLLSGVSVSGGTEGVDAWMPRARTGPSAVTLAAGVPVIPGDPVTVAVEASGAATVTVTWRNAAGASLGTVTASGTGTLMQRITKTVIAPVEARSLDLAVSGHVYAGRPQVTWTNHVVPWTVGGGAEQVLVQTGSVDLVALVRSGSYWGGALQIVEVG